MLMRCDVIDWDRGGDVTYTETPVRPEIRERPSKPPTCIPTPLYIWFFKRRHLQYYPPRQDVSFGRRLRNEIASSAPNGISAPKNALTTPLYMHKLENAAQYLFERCTICVNVRGLGDRHSCHAVAYRNDLDRLDVPVTEIVVVSGVCVRKESWQRA